MESLKRYTILNVIVQFACFNHIIN